MRIKIVVILGIIICMMLVGLTGCGNMLEESSNNKENENDEKQVQNEDKDNEDKDNEDKDNEDKDNEDKDNEDETSSGDDSENEKDGADPDNSDLLLQQEFEWPQQATDIGIPEFMKGTISGVNVIDQNSNVEIYMGISAIVKEDIEEYQEMLENAGFESIDKYGMEGIWNYSKNKDGNMTDITLAFSNSDATLVVKNKSENGEASGSAAGELVWLDTMPKEVPEFTKGTVIGTNNYSGMIGIEFSDVEQIDADQYREMLLNEGFVYEDDMYIKMLESMKAVLVRVELIDGKLTIYAAGM